MRYEIDEKDGFAIRIFKDGETLPVIYQPEWPNGTAWASKEEATAWAKLKIGEFDPNWTVMAGISPEEPSRPRPTKTEQVNLALSSLGISADDLKEILGL